MGVKQQIPQEHVATPAETREFFLKKAAREFAPLRREFVQRPRGAASRPGPLAEFVTNGDLRGLNAYLFIVAVTSTSFEDTGWSTTINGKVWARALGTTENATPASARTAVTKTLRRLQKRKLITFERVAGTHDIRVTLLREDGSGEPYTRPGAGNSDAYLKIPVSFWRSGLDGTLGIPGLAMLLVASCERSRFELATERMQDWYGWSPDTAERGFKELSEAGVLLIDKTYKKAPASPSGYAEVNLYSLMKPYLHRSASKAEEPKEVQI
jgi:hypothetical protein